MYHVDLAVWFDDSLPDQFGLFHRPLYQQTHIFFCIYSRSYIVTGVHAWSMCMSIRTDRRAANRSVHAPTLYWTEWGEMGKERRETVCVCVCAHKTEKSRCESNENGYEGWNGRGRNIENQKRNKEPKRKEKIVIQK